MKKNENNKITINYPNSDLKSFDSNKFKINLNRIAFIFILIFFIIILYSTRIIHLSSKTFKKKTNISNQISRADITDRNGNFISKSVLTTNIGIDPKLVKDKKKLLIKLQYTFPEKDMVKIKQKLYGKNFFYVDKKATLKDLKKLNFWVKNQLDLSPK